MIFKAFYQKCMTVKRLYLSQINYLFAQKTTQKSLKSLKFKRKNKRKFNEIYCIKINFIFISSYPWYSNLKTLFLKPQFFRCSLKPNYCSAFSIKCLIFLNFITCFFPTFVHNFGSTTKRFSSQIFSFNAQNQLHSKTKKNLFYINIKQIYAQY